MRNIIALFFVWTWFTFISYSQDSVTFKTQFKPEKNYRQTLEQNNYSIIKYSGSDEFIQKLNEKGVQNPTTASSNSTTELIMKVGKLTEKSEYPMTIEFQKTTSSDGKKIIPDGTIIYGHSSNGTMPKLDSIVSNELKEDFKRTFLKSMQSTFDQIVLPEKTVKVGESFSIHTPFSMPLADVTLEMDITTNYKLESIKSGIAYFKVLQTYTLKSKITKYTINATGNGEGELEYDITNNYNLKYQVNTQIKLNVQLDKFSIDTTTDNSIIQTTKMTEN